MAAGRCAPTTSSAATAAGRSCSEQARHHADAFGPRPADGAAGVPLARPAPAAGALPRQILLQRAASRARGLLEVLRPRRPRQHLVLPRAGAARHDQGQLRLPPVSACSGRRASSMSRSSTSASGICASPWPTPTATAASSSPAMPPTAIRPMAATASTRAWRMRSNLGWKLAAALQGWAGPKLLDSYDEERRPVFQSTARDFIAKAIETDREVPRSVQPGARPRGVRTRMDRRASRARAPRSMLSSRTTKDHPIACGPPGGTSSALGSHAFTARAGHHLSPHRLPSGRNVFEELGDGLTLLQLQRRQLPFAAAFETAARMAGIPLKVVRDDSSAGRARYQATHVLVRPDQFVAWASGEAPVDATDVLRKAIGAD